jgi:hypothetical protein
MKCYVIQSQIRQKFRALEKLRLDVGKDQADGLRKQIQ